MKRTSLLIRPFLLVWGFVLSSTVPLRLPAQGIRGRVVRSDGVTPAQGVLVSATRADSAIVTSSLSNGSGEYALKVRPGRYRLRALRIGFLPTVIDSIEVAAGATREQNIILTELPVDLPAMKVDDPRRCDLRRSGGATLLRLWEQARAALTSTRLTGEPADLEVRVANYAGHVDAVTFLDDPSVGPLLRALHPDADTAGASEAMVDRMFPSSPAETLFKKGYLRRQSDGEVVFDAPSAELLLSDAFAEGHCFGLVGPPHGHSEWAGVTFEPNSARDSVVDIRGTLWLDRSTAELRELEFDYVNVPPTEFTLCDPAPDRQHRPAGLANCDRDSNGVSRLGLGGVEDFRRLATGEWLVDRWMLRTFPDQLKWRFSGNRWRQTSFGSDKCFGGKDCQEIWVWWPRLVTRTGIVMSVRRAGREIYHDDAAYALIDSAAARRAGHHPAGLVGVITDDRHQPLNSAIVESENPGRVATTDHFGAFDIRRLPPVPLTVTVRCGGYRPIRFTIPLLPDSVRRVQLGLVPAANDQPSTTCSDVRR